MCSGYVEEKSEEDSRFVGNAFEDSRGESEKHDTFCYGECMLILARSDRIGGCCYLHKDGTASHMATLELRFVTD